MLYAATAVSRARVARRSPIASMASSPALARRIETRYVGTSKTEAIDGKKGRAADSAEEPVPGGHTLVPPLSPSEGPNPTSEDLSATHRLFDQSHHPIDLFGAGMQRRRQPIIDHLARP